MLCIYIAVFPAPPRPEGPKDSSPCQGHAPKESLGPLGKVPGTPLEDALGMGKVFSRGVPGTFGKLFHS